MAYPRKHNALLPVISTLTLGISAASSVHAQNTLQLEEIIVTAQKRTENAIDVPISMAIETSESLEKKGILDLQTLSINTPGLYLQDGGRTSQVAMRGLGSPGLDSVESSVGFYIDGVYFGRSRLSRNPLFDMERIEVLRGPQGTLYGRNTIAGAINMITAKPSEEFEGRILVEGGAGKIANHKVEAYVSGPIVGGLSGRVLAVCQEGCRRSIPVVDRTSITPRKDLTVAARIRRATEAACAGNLVAAWTLLSSMNICITQIWGRMRSCLAIPSMHQRCKA